MNQLKARFSDFNAKQRSGQSFAIEDMLVGTRQLLLIKEFKDRAAADAYVDLLSSDPKFLKSLAVPEAEFLVGDSKNLGLMIVNSDLEGFLKFTSTYYTQK